MNCHFHIQAWFAQDIRESLIKIRSIEIRSFAPRIRETGRKPQRNFAGMEIVYRSIRKPVDHRNESRTGVCAASGNTVFTRIPATSFDIEKPAMNRSWNHSFG